MAVGTTVPTDSALYVACPVMGLLSNDPLRRFPYGFRYEKSSEIK